MEARRIDVEEVAHKSDHRDRAPMTSPATAAISIQVTAGRGGTRLTMISFL